MKPDLIISNLQNQHYSSVPHIRNIIFNMRPEASPSKSIGVSYTEGSYIVEIKSVFLISVVLICKTLLYLTFIFNVINSQNLFRSQSAGCDHGNSCFVVWFSE